MRKTKALASSGLWSETSVSERFTFDWARPASGSIWVNFNGSAGDDIFNGGGDNDTIAGNGGNDQLSGGGGQDVIGGGSGADTLDGGDGFDRLYSFDISPPFNRPYYGNPWTPPVMDTGIEIDLLSGGAGGDELFAGYGDTADGGADSDTLYISFLGAPTGVTVDFRQLQNNGAIVIGGGTLSNIETIGWIEGSNFDDVITDGNGSSNFAPMFGRGGNDHLIGGYYSGNIYGGDGDDVIDLRGNGYGFQHFGEGGNDTLIGGSGYERLEGGDGNDIIQGNYGFDDLWGGEGDDSLDGGSFGDDLRGGAGNDTLYGAGDADTVDGGAGDDILYGDFSLISPSGNAISPSSNDERMWGGIGADIIHGNQGSDTIWSGERDGDFGHLGRDDAGLERDQLFGGDGNDTLAMGLGDDADGGTGSDSLRISLAGAASGVTFDTSGFVPGGIWSVMGGTVQNIEVLTAIIGSAFGDSISVATHAFGINVEGGAGDDLITSSGSSLIVNGGAGNDRFVSGIAGDVFDGGADVDTADYGQYGSAVVVTLALAAGGTGSGPGGDSLINVENVDGSAQGDTIGGSDQANVLRGLGGDDTLRGNGGHDVLIGGAGDDTMEGGLGNDLFHVDDLGDLVTEAAAQGNDRIIASLSYVLAASSEVETIETTASNATSAIDLTGSNTANTIRGNEGTNVLKGSGGNDALFGLGGDDRLEGGADSDVLDGGAGTDTMLGGLGDDSYHVDNGGDVVTEAAGEGNDRVLASVSYTLAAGASIELLTTAFHAGTGAIDFTGNELANTIYGNDGVNTLSGGGGADVLIGRAGNDVLDGGAGSDTASGGTGDDWFLVDNAGDVALEAVGEGSDRVFASVSFALTAGSEVELLSTDFNAGTAAIDLTGNERAQAIYGNAGANRLNGGGGADTMVGFAGDDIYHVDNSGDRALENAGEGNDRVLASVSYALAAGASIELLTTDFHAGTGAINFTGNELANTIYGNDGVNTLNGGGDADVLIGRAGNDVLDGGGGIDTASGGTGNDWYFVDAGGDVVEEAGGEGTDRVSASVSYALAAGSEVELLSTDFNAGTAAIDLTGNDGAQAIYGNAGANRLNGGGGADTMVGFAGDDIYHVDNSGDRAVENAGEGSDRVLASVSYTLEAGASIELISTDFHAGTGAIDFTGNELANTIYGNDGANILDGKGGSDVLIGRLGGDTFAFTTALGAGNVDSVLDFAAGTDKIALDDAVFTALGGPGALNANAFVTGAAAADADDRIIYDSATGALLYDADGNGAGAAVQFATLGTGLALGVSDFTVI